MPNVPNVPGVPTLASYLPSSLTLLVADAFDLLLGSNQGGWEILLNGAPAFDFESVAGLTYHKEWVIADYPIEDGSFLSYDKVEMPYICTLRITSGGTLQERQALIAAIEEAGSSLNLYDIVTPEKVYSNANPGKISYNRTAVSGVGMMIVEVPFHEVRQSQPAAFSQTQQPGQAGQQGGGNVQPVSPPQQVQQTFDLGAGVW